MKKSNIFWSLVLLCICTLCTIYFTELMITLLVVILIAYIILNIFLVVIFLLHNEILIGMPKWFIIRGLLVKIQKFNDWLNNK